MNKRVRSTPGSIEFTKGENDISLLIHHCNVIFKGSNLWIDTGGVSIQDNDNIGLIRDNGNIPIADDNEGLRITLNECAIKMEEGQDTIDYRGPLITFSKCTSKNNCFTFHLFCDKNIPKQWFQFQNLSHSEISLEKSRTIYAKNADIQTSLDTNKIFTISCTKATFVLPTDSKIELMEGKIGLLEGRHTPFAVNLFSGTTVDKLVTSNIEVSGIDPGPGTGTIDINGHNVSFSRLRGVSQMKFSNDAFHLASDSCDFSTTEIIVADSASFNINGFKSIATVWNPMSITYRGFNPRKSKNIYSKADALAAREFFCEMKTTFSDKGDSITAGDFHSAEMIAHRGYLKKKEVSLSQKGVTLLSDKFTMWVSHNSSNFGQEWWRALLWYIGIGFVFSSILIAIKDPCALSCFRFGWSWDFCCSNFDCVQLYANVLSPFTLSFNDLNSNIALPSWVSFFWMLWKIIAGFLIYQIIISSRRFIRKW